MVESGTRDSGANGRDALADAAAKYSRRIYRAARGMGFPAEDAEDLVQDVFTVFVATFDRFEGRSTVLTWLFGILIRKSHERRRALAKDQLHDELDDRWLRNFDAAGSWIRPPIEPDKALEDQQIADAIADCLPDLSPQQREVFTLRVVEGLSGSDVSKILGLTTTHTNVLLHRARLRMRDCLSAKGWKTSSP